MLALLAIESTAVEPSLKRLEGLLTATQDLPHPHVTAIGFPLSMKRVTSRIEVVKYVLQLLNLHQPMLRSLPTARPPDSWSKGNDLL